MAFLPGSWCVPVTKLTPRDKTANVNSCGKERQVKTFLKALRMLQLSQSRVLQWVQCAYFTMYTEVFVVHKC